MANDGIDAKVLRGQQSWTFIYVALGFVIAIEGTIIQMIPIHFPWNVIVYAAVAAATIWQFVCDGRVHDWLIGLKNKYENTPR